MPDFFLQILFYLFNDKRFEYLLGEKGLVKVTNFKATNCLFIKKLKRELVTITHSAIFVIMNNDQMKQTET